MGKRDVLLLLTDRWADWEASYAIAEINSSERYAVKTIGPDREAKASIGGLRAQIDLTIRDYRCLDDLAMLILPGGFSWGEHRYDEIAGFVRRVHEAAIPVAAICGATIFLARQGLLDHVKHTGDEPDYFFEQLRDQSGYQGAENYVAAQVVVDGDIITANETAAIDFAYEILSTLETDPPEELAAWRDTFKLGMIH